MSVKVTVGRAFGAFQEKNSNKTQQISHLEGIIEDKETEIGKLKKEISSLRNVTNQFQSQLEQSNKDRNKLQIQIETLLLNQDRLNNMIVNFTSSQKDLSESNKKVQYKIEVLNNTIEEKNKTIQRQNVEYHLMEKVKEDFEEKMIALSKQLDECKAKMFSMNNIIKQKERYIQMLLNEKKNLSNKSILNSSSSNNNIKTNKTSNNFHSINQCSTSQLKVQLTEKEQYIKKLEDKTKKLEIDNSNLIIRLRNQK